MTPMVGQQIRDLLLFVLLGTVAGFLYDMLRILRRAIKHNIVAVSVEDILYMLVLAFSLCFFFEKSNEGAPRLYLLLAIIFGWLLWQRLIGRHIVPFFAKILKKTTLLLTNLLKYIGKSVKIRKRFKT